MNKPSHISILDIGTNSFHLIIVRINEDNSFEIVERRRIVFRLVRHKVDDGNRISEDEISKSIEMINEFKKLTKLYRADLIITATSAVREAINKNEFISRVNEETGIKIEILDGSFEAQLIFNAALFAYSKNLFERLSIVDIGGGSTEVVIGNRNSIDFAISVKLGAVRLTHLFFPEFVISDKAVDDCRKHIVEIFETFLPRKLINENDLVVGTSGTILAILDILKSQGIIPYSRKYFTNEEFYVVRDLILSNKSLSERLKISGLEEKRADVIQAGIIILDEYIKYFNITKIYTSEYALREGVLLNYLNNNFRFVNDVKRTS